MKGLKRICALTLSAGLLAAALTGCGSINNGKRIVRISHAQSETHPEHLGLLKFKEYIEETSISLLVKSSKTCYNKWGISLTNQNRGGL